MPDGRNWSFRLNINSLNGLLAKARSDTDRLQIFLGMVLGCNGGGITDDDSTSFKMGWELGADMSAEADVFRAKQSLKGQASVAKRRATNEPRFNHGSTTVQPQGQPETNQNTKHKTQNTKLDTQTLNPKTQKNADAVERIYAAYPKKTAKQKAIEAIDKALRSVSESTLFEAVTAYAKATEEWPQDEMKFIPQPASWFNAGRWEDDRATWASKSKQNTIQRVPIRSFEEATANLPLIFRGPSAEVNQ